MKVKSKENTSQVFLMKIFKLEISMVLSTPLPLCGISPKGAKIRNYQDRFGRINRKQNIMHQVTNSNLLSSNRKPQVTNRFFTLLGFLRALLRFAEDEL